MDKKPIQYGTHDWSNKEEKKKIKNVNNRCSNGGQCLVNSKTPLFTINGKAKAENNC